MLGGAKDVREKKTKRGKRFDQKINYLFWKKRGVSPRKVKVYNNKIMSLQTCVTNCTFLTAEVWECTVAHVLYTTLFRYWGTGFRVQKFGPE